MMEFRSGIVPSAEALVQLYEAVGWSAYTKDPAQLKRAAAGSSLLISAWEKRELLGLARVISDGETIAYLQDILVHPDHQRRGIGRELFIRAITPFAHVRQKVLITDDEPGQRAFYESLGFTETRDVRGAGLRTFIRFD